MKTSKILSLLFSISQFILVLKLIEYVRGEETNLQENSERQSKHFFVAPNIQRKRKNRPWLSTSSTSTTTTTEISITDNYTEIIAEEEKYYQEQFREDNNSTEVNLNVHRSDLGGENISRPLQSGQNGQKVQSVMNFSSGNDNNSTMARLCPGCPGGTCTQLVGLHQFPIAAVAMSVVFLIVWIFLFAYLLKGGSKDDRNTGYGYGSGSLQGHSPSLTYDSIMDTGKSAVSYIFSDEFNSISKRISGAIEEFVT